MPVPQVTLQHSSGTPTYVILAIIFEINLLIHLYIAGKCSMTPSTWIWKKCAPIIIRVNFWLYVEILEAFTGNF